jgi:CTP synthase (UTP-ammonia lyase)
VDADHEESSPDAPFKLISKLTCSLVGQEKNVRILPGTKAHAIYGTDESMEIFACNYGLNENFGREIRSKDLLVSAHDDDGTVRMVELPSHPFFIATLFVPQVRSQAGKPHPLVEAYLKTTAQSVTERTRTTPNSPSLR